MEDRSVQILMLALAAATPVLAGVIHLNARLGRMSPPRQGRLLMLALAGPLNAGCWFLFNGRLEGVASRTTIGIVLAAIVFLGMGFGAGFLRRSDGGPQAGEADESEGHEKA